MWRTVVRSAAVTRPLHGEACQVIVRYASQTASRRPGAARGSGMSKATTRRTAYTKAGASKASKASAPTSPPKAAAKAYKPAAAAAAAAPTPATPKPMAAREPITHSVAPEPTTAAAAAAAPSVDPSKPIVLEKPERFNPPSHGARLPRSRPKHYGGPTTAEEVKAQSQRTYPGLPPPPNTWSHWFINNRGIHMFITLGTLTGLAVYTFALNFQEKSEFADLIPPISEFPRHPFQYLGVCVDVLRMHEEHESARTAEKRRRRVDDVAKRNEYRAAHGLEPANSSFFGSVRAEEPAEEPAAAEAPAAVAAAGSLASEPASDVSAESAPEGKRKKYLGIF
ncbi:putative major facilitator superfamily protein [Rosellinia necatrix]|uniref:Putative major facilitator superfamily protein n=1 Tax=Rosellinia necatrix TaxID=77044 RepID=A0A1W2TL44_ROSNE|nr:putative major facilitator superfamily protein [Rosellinia necatrix]